MPNWVFNVVSIEGDAEAVDTFVETVAKPHPMADGEESVFSFFNIVAPDMPIIEYHKDWYSWNVENWGTKWNACNARLEDAVVLPNGDKKVQYYFETAWCDPEPIMQAVLTYCTENNLKLWWAYEEEQGWGGEWELIGNGLRRSKYDIPESHAEYVGRDKECPCTYWDDFRFEDCPKKEVEG